MSMTIFCSVQRVQEGPLFVSTAGRPWSIFPLGLLDAEGLESAQDWHVWLGTRQDVSSFNGFIERGNLLKETASGSAVEDGEKQLLV